ncbi:MAG: hypothetical protein J1E63_08250 [Muribaculaceae bacterium]|nr:hypothetical protein [Muribaculaceae bacterium]
MSQYNYIKVSLYGQFGDGLKTAMRFPTAVEGQPETKMTVFNPTKVLDQFTNARECYAVWQTMTGCYYGLVTRNPLNPTTGAMLVTLMVPHGIILTGRQVIQALTGLRKTLVDDGNYTGEAVIAALRDDAGLPEHPAFFPELEQREKENRIPTEDGPKSTGYRTYANGHDLESILSFPYQTEYRFRRRILIVSASTALKPESTKLQRVQTPLEREFWVECPTGVAATPICGAEGDKISLIFSKAGYTPSKQTITAGIPSPYTKIEGSLIKVKTPAESGLSFTRRIKLNIKSAKGGAVNGYTINVNSRSINSMEPVVELTEHDMTAGKKITIAVASNNFRPVKLEKTPEELSSVETLDIILEPLEQGITLHLDFGEGRVFEQHISIERNTPEYSQLHSGNFHGFRAHRISGLGINEAYNVDVRSASRPTAPSYVNEAKTTTTTTTNTDGPKAPVFENVSRDNTSSSGTIEKPNITNATTGTDNSGEETTGGFSLSKLKIKGSVIIGVVLGIIVLVAAIKFLPGLGGKSNEETTDDPNIITAENLQGGGDSATGTTSDTPTVTPAETATTNPGEATTPAPATSTPSADEAADIEYLNSNTKVWKVSALKSQKYRDLIDAIKRGDIQAMANSDYFAVEGRATNKYANEMMEMAWKSLGTANEKGNVNALKKADGKDEIDVYGLYDALARVKPAKPNETPRPKR